MLNKAPARTLESFFHSSSLFPTFNFYLIWGTKDLLYQHFLTEEVKLKILHQGCGWQTKICNPFLYLIIPLIWNSWTSFIKVIIVQVITHYFIRAAYLSKERELDGIAGNRVVSQSVSMYTTDSCNLCNVIKLLKKLKWIINHNQKEKL